ncbi:ras-related protein Rab-44 isoform X1 [Scaptodrosophila lebanonensis]|uniref:Ras-related protein Rab-44 isoform X1 n=1 Tax=Drosophila lebanonensis TaxID=7225 RepID=A0A6J2UHN2_DROLE|nr:ras-related protein Rab-44 isoform X1 [Scaptodrosophila lebanonensis]
MQSAETKAPTTIDEENLTLAAATKAHAEHSTSGIEDQTEEQVEETEPTEEHQNKIKARSRFSAAFRSLSKTKPKKEKEREKSKDKEKPKSKDNDKPKDQSKTEQDQPESPSKSSLANVEELVDNSEVVSLDSGTKPKKKSLTQRLFLSGLKKSKVRPHSLNVSDEISVLSSSRDQDLTVTPSTSTSTVQITISGKKIEPVTAGGRSKSRKSALSETNDYLTPIPTTATSTATTTATTVAAIATGKAAAKSAKSTTTTTTVTTKDTSSSRTTKIIVAKLGKEAAAAAAASAKKKLKAKKLSPPNSQGEEKIVITESQRDTPPRERAPAKPSRASAIQCVSGSGTTRKSASGTSKTQSAQHATSKKSLRTVATIATATASVTLPSSRKERELMQQQQRGHRLIRPTTATHTATTTSIAKAQPGQGEQLEQAPVQFPGAGEIEQLPQPPNYAPPPVPPNQLTPEHRQLAYESDEHAVSSAESAHTGQDPVPSTEAGSVRFAVGSAVRPPGNAYEAALAAVATQQPSSSESQSDSSLRRLNFAQQQQQITGDHDSIEGRRETLRYQSVVSEYSDNSQSEDLEGTDKPMPAFGDLTMEQEIEPTVMTPSNEKREHLYKILVIGELGTGKTSFIKRYVHQFFSQNYRATIGVDFALKVLHWDANTIVRLQLWDIAGQERFGNMTRVYYKEAVGAFIVFDVTRSGTFDCVSKWKEDLDSKVQLPDGSPIPCILLANKCDQDKQGIVTQPEKMDEYVRENGFAGWFETSAKENTNIDEAARALVNKILINDKLITAADLADAEKFNLNNPGDGSGTESKNKCSC